MLGDGFVDCGVEDVDFEEIVADEDELLEVFEGRLCFCHDCRGGLDWSAAIDDRSAGL